MLDHHLCAYVDEHQDRLAAIARDLVRIPSENTPPHGNEQACQHYIAGLLGRIGWQPILYRPDEVPALTSHPLYWPGRDYTGRPNLGARRSGTGGGRSLLLSGHVDTVPRGTEPWTRDPFGGEIEGNRLYGRGANDMKGGVATSLFVVEAIAKLGLELEGDLVFETVVDEEFGGSNGTLAGRLAGFNADAAILPEPSFLRICPAQRGGRTAHITLRAPGGVLTEGKFPTGVLEQVRYFLTKLQDFAAARCARVRVNQFYKHHPDPVPVSVTKIFTGPWGPTEPITIPEVCQLEIYWQTMPGEVQQEVEREFFEWLEAITAAAPELFAAKPQVEFPIRWLPGSFIPASEPIVTELTSCAAEVLGRQPPVVGIEGPCDMYIFHEFGIPAVLWGPRGGNTHAADEYLELDSAVAAAKTLLLFVCRWCGAAVPDFEAVESTLPRSFPRRTGPRSG
ncbi:MAG: M20/M25/M40 family metallo-hydrolase [Acidobacteria bacterium]|nr:M20/M25/M40 family metallo-hydrolase [Acidobacteriota bacterium]